MLQRTAAALIAIAALALACYDAFAPPASGVFGMSLTYADAAVRALHVVPGGPAFRAGIRDGAVIAFSAAPFATRYALTQHGLAGVPYVFAAEAGARMRTVEVTPVPDPLDSRTGRYIDLGLAAVYVAFAFLLMFKAPKGALTDSAVWLTVLMAFANATADYQFVAVSELRGFFVGQVVQFVCNWSFAALAIRAIFALDAGPQKLRERIARWAPALALLNLAGPELPYVLAVAPAPYLLARAVVDASSAVAVAYGFVAGLGAIALVQAARPEVRVRSRWFASSLVLCWFFGFSIWCLNDVFIGNTLASILLYYLVSFALVGPIYATLRHRLIDLDVVVSRSAIFAAVSAVMVASFVAAEWAAGRIADALTGQGRWHGLTAQALSFAAAIAIGISFRRVHAQTEQRVNALVFRERERRLRLLESFAHEADLIDSRDVLLKVTFEALSQSLETSGIALYIRDGTTFACARTSSAAAPERLDKSDRLILRILYRPETFTAETPTLRDWLIVPLMARAEVTGFIACGQKPDRTHYLAQERQALELLAHHAGTSYAMLPAQALV
ncbi:MAG TPA: GAF domain-containing protein [Candidatus Baltobacteraceae bacterium]|nr:GAF domain-containing protein [Candidatus Baltobacteraceae bacterium]